MGQWPANVFARSSKKRSSSNSFKIIEIKQLKEHEGISQKLLRELKEKIEADGVFTVPIAVDEKTNVILDGHHRLNALKKLGYKKIPVKFIDYMSSKIVVESWRPDMEVTKEDVIKMAESGKKFPAKTTKHMIIQNGKRSHISSIEGEVEVPLEELK